MELRNYDENVNNQEDCLMGKLEEITELGWEGRLGWKIGDIDIDEFLEQNIGKEIIIKAI